MHRHARVLCALTVLAAGRALSAGSALADDWPRFRGPNGSGAAPDSGLPVEISAATAAWTGEVPFGHSSPIVIDGKVFLTGLLGDALATMAFDARTGEEVWRRSVPRLRVDAIAPESGPAVPTPVADAAGVSAPRPLRARWSTATWRSASFRTRQSSSARRLSTPSPCWTSTATAR